MTGILITIQEISHCWTIDGPEEENVSVSELHLFDCLNKALWSFLNEGKAHALQQGT
jgi:hypothetical protein